MFSTCNMNSKFILINPNLSEKNKIIVIITIIVGLIVAIYLKMLFEIGLGFEVLDNITVDILFIIYWSYSIFPFIKNINQLNKNDSNINTIRDPYFHSLLLLYVIVFITYQIYSESNSVTLLYGGYLEHRDIYDSFDLFKAQTSSRRNIHLGIDIWAPFNHEIFLPISGTVHSFKDNTEPGSYGPTIIIKHTINQVTFYTLYGHISKHSLKN